MRHVPFFYGWVIVGGAALNAGFVLGSAQFALSTFLIPMESDLGWSRTTLFGALSIRYLLAGLLGPLTGPWGDGEVAPRFVIPVGVAVLSFSLGAVKWIEDPFIFVLVYGVLGAIGTALTNLTMWEAVVLKWFVKKRTRALVVGSVGEASGPMIFPILVTFLIAWVGWRDAWLYYGLITAIVLMPAALLVRTRPDHLGQAFDGDPVIPHYRTDPLRATPSEQIPTTQSSDQLEPDSSLTRAQAFQTCSFWLLAGSFTLSGIVVTGFQSQWVPYFRDEGFLPVIAASAISVYGLFNILSRVLWGILAARFSLRALMATHATAAAIGVVTLLTLVEGRVSLFVWAAYQGLVLGSFFSLHTFISAEYFGRVHIGSIRGIWQFPTAISRAAGPLLIGALREIRGSYALAFWGVAIGWVLMGAIATASKKPNQRSSSPDISD